MFPRLYEICIERSVATRPVSISGGTKGGDRSAPLAAVMRRRDVIATGRVTDHALHMRARTKVIAAVRPEGSADVHSQTRAASKSSFLVTVKLQGLL